LGFQSLGSSKAAATGDIAMIGSEVNPVIWTLRDNGIEVTALHNQMAEVRAFEVQP
jgi:Domain of Unknown Function (DUF1259)